MLIYLKLVNLKLKIMRTRMQIPREKHKRFIPINSETKATVYASSILKLKPLNAYLHLAVFGFTFSFSATITI